MRNYREDKYPSDIFSITSDICRHPESFTPAIIKSVTGAMLRSVSVWQWRMRDKTHFPLVGIYPTKGYTCFKNTYTTHIVIFKGTYNEYVLPSICRISIQPTEPYKILEVVGHYSLDTKHVSYNSLIPMDDAYEIFDTKDKAIMENNELIKDKIEIAEKFKSMNVIHTNFKLMLGGFFKDFFKIDIKNDDPNTISEAYADEVYNILSKAFVITIMDKEQLKRVSYPVISVATLPSTIDYLLSMATEKPLFKNYTAQDIVAFHTWSIPMIIAGLHHTAFRNEYIECKSVIMDIKSKNEEIVEDDSNIITSW